MLAYIYTQWCKSDFNLYFQFIISPLHHTSGILAPYNYKNYEHEQTKVPDPAWRKFILSNKEENVLLQQIMLHFGVVCRRGKANFQVFLG